MSAQETRAKLIEQGARLIHEYGYHSTGISDVLQAAGVPKGSFYFHFKNKEEFGLEVVDFFRGHFMGQAKKNLTGGNGPALERLATFFKEFEHFFDQSGGRLGCPVGNLATELGDVNDRFRVKLAGVFEEMRDAIGDFLVLARENGELPADLDLRGVSEFVLQGWEGALVRMKVTGNISPLVTFRSIVFDYLGGLKPSSEGAIPQA